MRKFHQLLLISLVPLAACGAAFAQGATAPSTSSTATPDVFYAQGMKNFKVANYSYAEHYLRMAAKARPTDAMIRYYLATCLVYLHRHPEAIAQYRKSYQLEPYGLVSGFCRRALLAYGEPVEGTTDARLIVRKPRAKRKVDEAQLEKVITQGEMQMDAAVITIRRQAEDEKSRKRTYAKDLAENALKAGDHKAIRIKEDAEDQIRELVNGEFMRDKNGIIRGRGSSYERLSALDAEVVRQRTEQIRREAEAKAKLEKDIAAERSKNYQDWSEKRQSDLDKVADNLEKQLQLKPAQKSVSINPVGTGLYVRNYTAPREKGPDARLGVVRFVDRLDDPTHRAELGGSPIENSSSEDLDSKEVSEQVSGKVVDDKRVDKRVLEKIGDLDQSGTAGKSEKQVK